MKTSEEISEATKTEKKEHRFFTLKNKRTIPLWLAWFFAQLVKLIAWTYRVTIEDDGELVEKREPWPVIYALWHNRILFSTAISPDWMVKGSTVLISASRDGEYVSKFVRCFGIGVVRGSSSHGGVQALLGLRDELKQGHSTVLTLDGPRGPKYSVHPGIILLAQAGHFPIIPVAINAEKYWQIRSWDNTQIPKPFTKVTLKFGKPVQIPSELSREEGAERVKEAMMAINKD